MTKCRENWETAILDDLLTYVLGGDWGNDPNDSIPESSIVRCIRAAEIKKWSVEKGRSAAFRRVKNGSLHKRALKNGDILVEISGGGPEQPVGRVIQVTDESIFGLRPHAVICTNFFRFCRPTENINATFLYWYLKYFYESNETEKLQSGSNNLRNLRFPDYLSQFVPLPPFLEQGRIVEKIETLFDEIDKGVESLKAAKAALALYRQSLLKAAFEGRLTAEWRAQTPEKHEDPQALLARIRKEREARYESDIAEWKMASAEAKTSQNGLKPSQPKKLADFSGEIKDPQINLAILPEGWLWAQLGLCSKGSEYGTSAKSADSGDCPVIRMGNLQAGKIDWGDLVYTSDPEEIQQYSLAKGDVLFNRTNSPELVGKTSIYNGEKPALFAGYLVRVNQIESIALGAYVNYFLNSPIAREQGKKVKTDGVNQSNINATKLQNYPFPFCSTDEQAEIVGILDLRLDAAARLAAELDQGLNRADAMRQSILKQAFTGQLVPQDPSDEPAAVLLNRIHAERAAAPKGKRKVAS